MSLLMGSMSMPIEEVECCWEIHTTRCLELGGLMPGNFVSEAGCTRPDVLASSCVQWLITAYYWQQRSDNDQVRLNYTGLHLQQLWLEC